MLNLLIIFAACIQISSFAVIDSNNCINGASFTTKCAYKIIFTNIGNKSLHCILNFTLSNPTVKFNNYGINITREEAGKCPDIELNITNIVDGEAKQNKLSTTCGGEIEEMERKFSNFTSSVIKLDTKGLNDQDSKVDMSLVIDGYCSESEKIKTRENLLWIIIIILSIIVLIFLIIGVLWWYCLCCPKPSKYEFIDKENQKRGIPGKGKIKPIHHGSSEDIEEGEDDVQQEILEEENSVHHGSSDDIEEGEDYVQQEILEEENSENDCLFSKIQNPSIFSRCNSQVSDPEMISRDISFMPTINNGNNFYQSTLTPCTGSSSMLPPNVEYSKPDLLSSTT